MRKDSHVETSFLLTITERVLRLFSLVSAYRWIFWLMRKKRRWLDDELIPFWFAEAYILTSLLLLSLAFWLTPVESRMWYVCLLLAGYRLFDLAQGLASIIVFEPQRRRDEEGGYILVRHGVRWVLLTILNFAEIVLYFSFVYLIWGESFSPPITTRVGAIYQSLATFIAGGGSSPTNDLAHIVVILHLGYFVFFLVMITPIILSVIRAKERTSEVLGQDIGPDKRI